MQIPLVRTLCPSWRRNTAGQIRKGTRLVSSRKRKADAGGSMKRYTGIYEQIYDFANLERAYKKARRCKRYRNEVLRYSRNLEENLINLQNHLIWHSYEQGIYRTFYVYEPKKPVNLRPSVRRSRRATRDQQYLEPLIDRRFYYIPTLAARKRECTRLPKC